MSETSSFRTFELAGIHELITVLGCINDTLDPAPRPSAERKPWTCSRCKRPVHRGADRCLCGQTRAQSESSWASKEQSQLKPNRWTSGKWRWEAVPLVAILLIARFWFPSSPDSSASRPASVAEPLSVAVVEQPWVPSGVSAEARDLGLEALEDLRRSSSSIQSQPRQYEQTARLGSLDRQDTEVGSRENLAGQRVSFERLPDVRGAFPEPNVARCYKERDTTGADDNRYVTFKCPDGKTHQLGSNERTGSEWWKTMLPSGAQFGVNSCGVQWTVDVTSNKYYRNSNGEVRFGIGEDRVRLYSGGGCDAPEAERQPIMTAEDYRRAILRARELESGPTQVQPYSRGGLVIQVDPGYVERREQEIEADNRRREAANRRREIEEGKAGGSIWPCEHRSADPNRCLQNGRLREP